MANAKLVLVTGATGRQGGSVVRALLAAGHRVRALTRKPSSPASDLLRQQGVEVVAGDLRDRESLARAAHGVDTLFAVTTPYEQGPGEETREGNALVDAARAARVGHVVYSSVASADRKTGIPHFESKAEVERHLVASGVPYTIVAPVYFMENLLSPWMISDLREGRLSQALPADRLLQEIAVADIGAFVALVIERGHALLDRRFDIAGDELTGEQAAAILSDVIGRKIRYQGFPPAALRTQSQDLARMFEWFDEVGYAADIEGLRDEFPEVGWHDFEGWARQQDWNRLMREPAPAS